MLSNESDIFSSQNEKNTKITELVWIKIRLSWFFKSKWRLNPRWRPNFFSIFHLMSRHFDLFGLETLLSFYYSIIDAVKIIWNHPKS
jgi:hypothetical protein